MGHLVEELLLLARMDEGRPLDSERVDLAPLAAEAVEAARAVGPELPLRLEAAEPVDVMGDRGRLRQVFDNLLSNVRAHTPPGTGATVRISRQGDQAVCVVADDGPGMTEEQAARAFERFFRPDPSRSRTSGGTGLGLSIVAAIVGAHGGTVEAGAGRGAVLTIRLPPAPPRAPAQGPAEVP